MKIVLLSIIILILIILFIRDYNIKNNELVKFYQIWLRGDSLSNTFIVLSGTEKGNKLITDNKLIFYKQDYLYAILPFANLELKYKDLKKYDEVSYLKMCLSVTNQIRSGDND